MLNGMFKKKRIVQKQQHQPKKKTKRERETRAKLGREYFKTEYRKKSR